MARACVLAVLGLAAAADADTPAPGEETPWSKGVSAENKATAQRLLGEGNALYVVDKFREALEKYEAAIAAWEHPAIRFNMVRTLIALDRPLDAQASLDKALAYGQGPLEDTMYKEALNYRRLLASQIATLELRCKQAAVDIKVDSQKFLDCPGNASKQMLPGSHVLVASKPGFKTETRDLVLLPGKTEPVVIELVTIESATIYKTRWATWKPWAVAGGGVVLAGLGALINWQANSDLDRLHARLRDDCAGDGCKPDEYAERYQADEDRIILQNRIGIGAIAVGGAVVAAGVVGVILNRPKPYLQEKREPSTQVAPMFVRDGGGVAVTARF